METLYLTNAEEQDYVNNDWKFTWGHSAYRVCVFGPNGKRVGTFDTDLAYGIPREAVANDRI